MVIYRINNISINVYYPPGALQTIRTHKKKGCNNIFEEKGILNTDIQIGVKVV